MSTPKNDGGPAFPTPGEQFIEGPQGRGPASQWGMEGKSGMTLRDWFAGQALAGMLANERYPDMTPAECAVVAYSQADAMLAAREGKQ